MKPKTPQFSSIGGRQVDEITQRENDEKRNVQRFVEPFGSGSLLFFLSFVGAIILKELRMSKYLSSKFCLGKYLTRYLN